MSLRRFGSFVLFSCLLSIGSLACHDECENGASRCNGNVLEDCPGIDAWGPLRWVSEGPCEDPNSVCVEANERAACVAAPATSCTTGQAPVCLDGTDVLECDSLGYLEQYSCGPESEPPCVGAATGWTCKP